MAVAALAIYVGWFFVAFVLRTLVQMRRTRDSGWRGLSGRPGSIEWWTGVLFTVSLVAGALAPLAALAGTDAVAALDRSCVAWSGVVLALAGVAATFAAQIAMRDSWRIGVDPDERTDLVIDGPFRLVRNPIYTTMLITAVGLALMVPNLVAFAGCAALLVALELQVRVIEEPHLLAVHGDPYRAYSGRVGRFLPGIGRLDRAS